MTLFFNLDNLEKESGYDYIRFVKILEGYFYKRIPKNNRSVRFEHKSIAGTSFLLHPAPLFENQSADIAYKIQYIRLAARRDYNFYKQYNYRGLQLSYFPDLNLDSIKTNPLLKITQTEILFLYEEKHKEQLKWH